MLDAPKDYPRDPRIRIIPTAGPEVSKYDLHWALWILYMPINSECPLACPIHSPLIGLLAFKPYRPPLDPTGKSTPGQLADM